MRRELFLTVLGVLAAGAPLLCSGCAAPQRATLGDLVEPEDFASRLGDAQRGRVVVLDVREAAAYDAGHVAGAVHVDPKQWKDESLAAPTELSHDAVWHKRIGALGIAGDEPVVVYDDGKMTEAARIWFIFQHFGVADVGVLDGGYRALGPLISAKRVATETNPTVPRAAEFRPAPGTRGEIGLVERQRVLKSIERHDAQILDVRTPDEYSGKDRRKNPRGGHLPTAINLSHTQLLNEDGRLKSPPELADVLRKAGLRRDQPIITHCESGGRASLAALAAKRAGYGPVMNYYLSFGDWAADATCPVEAGGEAAGRE